MDEMDEMDESLKTLLRATRDSGGNVLVLTGAGISAESGIPTFRGQEGYWVVGSRNYMPQEMATLAMFERSPEEVWRWYLYRFGTVTQAQPNAGHHALVTLERAIGERFRLVTQNIDGLHRRSGQSRERTYCVHGDAAWVRCSRECSATLLPMPPTLVPRLADGPLSAAERQALTCPRCGEWLRPHVLWFDEYYDEPYYRMESALSAAHHASLLIVVGTSGATSLPMQVGQIAFHRDIPIIDVNPEPNPFAELAEAGHGFAARGTATELLPAIVRELTA